MKLSITGSRSFMSLDMLTAIMAKVMESTGRPEMIVTGDAQGADSWARVWALQNHAIPTLIVPAKWRKDDGTKDLMAGYARNPLIVQYADQMLFLWDGTSRGTAHTIYLAEQANKRKMVKLFGAHEKDDWRPLYEKVVQSLANQGIIA